MKMKVLDFKYCECGCKGYSAGAGDNSYWIFWDLKEKYTLSRGHGWCGNRIGDFPSFVKAQNYATKLFKIELKELSGCLE
jgi:hypothetical protein